MKLYFTHVAGDYYAFTIDPVKGHLTPVEEGRAFPFLSLLMDWAKEHGYRKPIYLTSDND